MGIYFNSPFCIGASSIYLHSFSKRCSIMRKITSDSVFQRPALVALIVCQHSVMLVWSSSCRPTYALVLGGCVHGESVDSLQVLGGELVGRSQLDLRLHVSQVEPGGQGARVVVALLGLLDEGV